MPLVVETGSGVAGADSFVDVTDFADYLLNFHGIAKASSSPLTSLTGTTVDHEAAGRRAMVFLASQAWKGDPVHPSLNSCPFPRSGLTRADGYEIPSNTVPQEIKNAQLEIM